MSATASTTHTPATINQPIVDAQPKVKVKGRVRKWLLRVALAAFLVAMVAQMSYTYSGSNQWEKVGEQNGTTVYSFKTPGYDRKQFKAVWKVHSTLSNFVKFARDSASDPNLGVYDAKDIDKHSDQLLWNSFKVNFPKPFKPRQFVFKSEFWQDQTTKVLTYNVTASPDKLPPDDCCFRIALMNNTWRVTPLTHGDVELEWTINADAGLLYLIANKAQVPSMFYFASRMQEYLDKEQQKNAHYDWIQEVQP